MSYLKAENLPAAAAFVNSPLWADFKQALYARRPAAPEAEDKLRTQAAKGMERKGFEKAIETLELLSREVEVKPVDPFDRPAMSKED